MDGHETNGLFRQVVRRFDVGFGDETKVTFRVFEKTLGQIDGLAGVDQLLESIVHQLVADSFQAVLEKLWRGKAVAAMNDAE